MSLVIKQSFETKNRETKTTQNNAAAANIKAVGKY